MPAPEENAAPTGFELPSLDEMKAGLGGASPITANTAQVPSTGFELPSLEDMRAGAQGPLPGFLQLPPKVEKAPPPAAAKVPEDLSDFDKNTLEKERIISEYRTAKKAAGEQGLTPETVKAFGKQYADTDNTATAAVKSLVPDLSHPATIITNPAKLVTGGVGMLWGLVKGGFEGAGALPATLVTSNEANNILREAISTVKPGATPGRSGLWKELRDISPGLADYIPDERASFLARTMHDAGGKYDPRLAAAAKVGQGIFSDDYKIGDPKSLIKFANESPEVANRAATERAVEARYGNPADLDFEIKTAQGLVTKVNAGGGDPSKALSPEQFEVWKKLPTGAVENTQSAAQILGGLAEGMAGTTHLASSGVSNVRELFDSDARAKLDRLAAAQESREIEMRGADESTQKVRGDVGIFGAMLDPALAATTGVAGVLGKALAPAIESGASSIARVAARPASATGEGLGGATLRFLRGHDPARYIMSNLAKEGGRTAFEAIKAPVGLAARTAAAYPEAATSAIGQGLAFGGLSAAADEGNPLDMGMLPAIAHAGFGALSNPGSIAKLIREVGPQEALGLRNLANVEAYSKATPEAKVVMQNAERQVANYNNAASMDSNLPLMDFRVFETPEQVTQFADTLKGLSGDAKLRFNPDTGGFTVELPDAGVLGNDALKGKPLVLSATFTGAPNFIDAFLEEFGHIVSEAMPEKFIKDLNFERPTQATEALRKSGVEDADLDKEYAAQQLADFFKRTGFKADTPMRSRIAAFFEGPLGGLAGTGGETVGTRGVERSPSSAQILSKASRDASSPLGILTARTPDLAAPTRFTADAPGAPVPHDILLREASYSNPVFPQNAVAARALLSMEAGATPEAIRPAIEEVLSKKGSPKLTESQIDAAEVRARELRGIESIASIEHTAEATKAAEAAAKQARGTAQLETTSANRRFEAMARNAKSIGEPITEAQLAREGFADALNADQYAVLDSKVRATNKAIQNKLDAEDARITKLANAQAAEADRLSNAENKRGLAAYWNEVARKAADEKAAAKEAGLWNAQLEKQSLANEKAIAEQAAEAAKSPELVALEAAKGDLKALGVTPVLAGQVSRHLKSNLESALLLDTPSILAQAKEALSTLAPDIPEDAKRTAVLNAASGIRAAILGKQGLEVLTNPTVAEHPAGITPAQWDAVVKFRGQATLADAANEFAHKVIRAALAEKNAADIQATGRPSFNPEMLGTVLEALPEDAGKASAKDLKEAAAFVPPTPAETPASPPAPNTVVTAQIFSHKGGPARATERRPFSTDLTTVRDAVERNLGLTREELNTQLTSKQVLEEGLKIPEVSGLSKGLLASGADQAHTLVIAGPPDAKGVVPVHDITQFGEHLNTLLKDKTAGRYIEQAVQRLSPQWDAKSPITDSVALDVFTRMAEEAEANGRTLSGVRIVEGTPSEFDVGVGQPSRLSREQSFYIHTALGGDFSGAGAERGAIVKTTKARAQRVSDAIRAVDRSPARLASPLADLSAGTHEAFESPQALAETLRLENTFHTVTQAELTKNASAPIATVPYLNTGTKTVGGVPGLRPFYAGKEVAAPGPVSRIPGIIAGAAGTSEARKARLTADTINAKQ